MAACAHVSRDLYSSVHAQDMWQLPLVLGIFMSYLYTRSPLVTLLVYLAFFFFETAVYTLAQNALSGSSASLRNSHGRRSATLFDPLIAGVALIFVSIILDGTVVGLHGAGGDPVAAAAAQLTWRTVLVLLATFLTGFVRIYYVSLLVLLSVIWIVYLAESSDYGLWLAVRATGFTVFFGAAFFRPIGSTFRRNSWMSVAAAMWFASIVQFVYEQQI